MTLGSYIHILFAQLMSPLTVCLPSTPHVLVTVYVFEMIRVDTVANFAQMINFKIIA